MDVTHSAVAAPLCRWDSPCITPPSSPTSSSNATPNSTARPPSRGSPPRPAPTQLRHPAPRPVGFRTRHRLGLLLVAWGSRLAPSTTTPADRPARSGDKVTSVARRAGVEVVVFDVNETLSDMAPMAGAFADVGAPPQPAALWSPRSCATGSPSRRRARGAFRGARPTRAPHGPARGRARCLSTRPSPTSWPGRPQLPVHPDVSDAVARCGPRPRLVTLSNGAVQVAEGLLERSGLRGEFEQLLSVDALPPGSPTRVLRLRTRACGVAPRAPSGRGPVPWDVDGAARAGLFTAFVRSDGRPTRRGPGRRTTR